ncbi:glycoside hydrolase family 3 C-terminal domain-containing protein [Streptomyces sp. NPDC097619]|uniref:glycoside hydrolase family 3 C-terminal domain-containing protein n=1 Tax=Streptomyces sp. NPDC097619 TaxID=3157228 RepID=UPI00332D6A25
MTQPYTAPRPPEPTGDPEPPGSAAHRVPPAVPGAAAPPTAPTAPHRPTASTAPAPRPRSAPAPAAPAGSVDPAEAALRSLDAAGRVRLLTGADTWRTAAVPALGLRALVLSDGPAGIRGESWDERRTSALLPSASALGALWDEPLVERLGALLAAEARRKGVDVVLGPTLNLHRSPLGGRHFECFSEDPELTGRTGAALIRGIQAHGVAATAKHFVANDSETDRLIVDVRMDPRTLREVYLAPFEAAVAAGVWVVMAGYNSVGGHTMTAGPLLRDPLKTEWGFDGVVVSDWGAVRTAEGPARAGLDLAMPGPEGPWAEELLRALREGRVPAEAVEDKVRRLLRLAVRVGALGPVPPPDRPGRAVPRRAPTAAPAPAPADADAPAAPRTAAAVARPPGPGETRRLLRRAASAAAVLLHNRSGALPLDPHRIRSLAVIGTHATEPRLQGGGSAGVFPDRAVTPLDGIRARLGPGVRVTHVPGPPLGLPPAPVGPGTGRDPVTGAPGIRLRVLDGNGRELLSEHRLSGRQLEPGLPTGARTVELSCLLGPGRAGEWTLSLAGFGRMSLELDGRTLFDADHPRRTEDPAVIHVSPPARTVRAPLDGTRPVLLTARRALAPGTGRATVLGAAPPAPPYEEALAEAVDAARTHERVVLVVGTTEHSETEGADRAGLRLDGPQDALAEAVLAADPRTVVVLNCGAPVELPWRDRAGALLLGWFPGQEAGDALADVLFGAVEPAGRLPTTWPAELATAPVTAVRPHEGRLEYTEGLHLGHRGWLRSGREPAYWFGHGLGYTTWEYEHAEVPAEVPAGAGFTVRVRVRNTGTRSGREVVQVYLARPGSAVERPVRRFAGYAAVRAAPGADALAEVAVPARVLRHWDPGTGRWDTEPGPCRVLVGRSAGDPRLFAETLLTAVPMPGGSVPPAVPEGPDMGEA